MMRGMGIEKTMGAPKLTEAENIRVRKAMLELLKKEYDGNQSRLAEALGRIQPSISEFLKGRVGASFDTARRLAILLRQPVWTLLGEVERVEWDHGDPHPARARFLAANREALPKVVVDAMLSKNPTRETDMLYWLRRAACLRIGISDRGHAFVVVASS